LSLTKSERSSSVDSNKLSVTVRETIADPLQEKIIQAGETLSSNLWVLGDLAEEAVAEKPPKASTEAILVNVGILSGKSGARVGDLRSTANFYPKETREQYPSLTHSHFFVAKAAGDLEKATEYLQKAEESADLYGGIRMPVGKLAAQIAEDNRDEDTRPVWYKWMRGAYANAKRIDLNRGKEEIPQGIAFLVMDFIDAVEAQYDGEEFLNGEKNQE